MTKLAKVRFCPRKRHGWTIAEVQQVVEAVAVASDRELDSFLLWMLTARFDPPTIYLANQDAEVLLHRGGCCAEWMR